jgi:hypothetical protein
VACATAWLKMGTASSSNPDRNSAFTA